ncbi:MAG: accessory factor UbiK family protein [Alphaproteobacteria bacterium]|nr:accessory factor UbiK family protein [Alphaproteobacteria bacterium]
MMQSQNRLLDDLARAATGAMGALGGLKAELDQQVKALVERVLKNQDLVTREEFEAVKEMAARARTENEVLQQRLAELESRLGASTTAS